MTALFPQLDRLARLEVTDLAMSRGGHMLFEGLSSTVNSGDVLWIQGDNGIGKTTLLEALAGLSRPDRGDISWVDGETLADAHDIIAYQPHKSFSKSTLTTREDLSFWAKLNKTENLIDFTLERVELSERHSVDTQNLSAGQRRRLALAKLIVSQKPIWIMDEPSAAMDKDGVDLIDSLIQKHIKRGGSAIIASHANTRKLGATTCILTLRATP